MRVREEDGLRDTHSAGKAPDRRHERMSLGHIMSGEDVMTPLPRGRAIVEKGQ